MATTRDASLAILCMIDVFGTSTEWEVFMVTNLAHMMADKALSAYRTDVSDDEFMVYYQSALEALHDIKMGADLPDPFEGYEDMEWISI